MDYSIERLGSLLSASSSSLWLCSPIRRGVHERKNGIGLGSPTLLLVQERFNRGITERLIIVPAHWSASSIFRILSVMEEQPTMSEFTTLAFSPRFDTGLDSISVDVARNIHKRPCPFDIEDGPHMLSGSTSPSTPEPKEPLQLLGSVSHHIDACSETPQLTLY
jgi:hypothetical protein